MSRSTTVRLSGFVIATAAVLLGITGQSLAFNWVTRSYDLQRTSANTSEVLLTQSNVNSHHFGKLFSLPVDDNVYAQPLYVSQVPVPNQPAGTPRPNVVYVATVNNSIYAFNADTGAPVWSPNPVSLNPTGLRAPTTSEISGGCTDLAPGKSSTPANTGIVGTPVIDPASFTMYVAARTIDSSNTIAYGLWALDIRTGSIVKQVNVNPGAAISIPFNAAFQYQRAGLAFAQGVVYVAFGGNCDQSPPNSTYRGWLVAYDTTLTQVGLFVSTGAAFTGDSGTQGGIWQAGNAPAFDTSGNGYIAIGNGTFRTMPTGDYGESVYKFAPHTLNTLDSFTPSNYSALNAVDEEIGSAAPVVLPGRSTVVQIGKPGVLQVMSQSNLGGVGGSRQSFQATATNCGTSFGCRVFGGTVAWVGPASSDPLNIYMFAESDSVRAFRYRDSTGLFDQQPFATATSIPSIGGSLSLSSNGSNSGTGVLWATTFSATDAGTFYALNAENLGLLWSSATNSLDSSPSLGRYNPPTIANGKVYVGTFSKEVDVYGYPEQQLLWWNKSTGQVLTWFLSGLNVGNRGAISNNFRYLNGTCGSGCSNVWAPIDTIDDNTILWFNPTSGQIGPWTYDTSGNVATGLWSCPPNGNTCCPSSNSCSTDWRPIGRVTLKNPNPTPGLIWHNAKSGQLVVWWLSGSTVTGNSLLSSTCGGSCSQTWRAVTTGDFNNDGQSDILWYDQADGRIGYWTLNGTTVTSTPTINGGCGSNCPYRVVDAGDVDGDGNVDVLWHNPSTGDLAVWFLDGAGNVPRNGSLSAQCGSASGCSSSWTAIGFMHTSW